jgi:hypothetical protein
VVECVGDIETLGTEILGQDKLQYLYGFPPRSAKMHRREIEVDRLFSSRRWSAGAGGF